MTRKYTAADFENARFAEHESGRAIAIRWTHDYGSEPDDYWVYERPLNNRFSLEATHQEMADMDGWVPVFPARTIHDRDVEALCTDTASYERDDYLDGFIRGFQQAGGTILDDPEPTNTERLTDLLKKAPIQSIDAWAEYLNDHGVTAPNVKGN